MNKTAVRCHNDAEFSCKH